jgi:hypothetical protein
LPFHTKVYACELVRRQAIGLPFIRAVRPIFVLLCGPSEGSSSGFPAANWLYGVEDRMLKITMRQTLMAAACIELIAGPASGRGLRQSKERGGQWLGAHRARREAIASHGDCHISFGCYPLFHQDFADFSGDAAEDLAIGVLGDTINGVAGAGSVTVICGIVGVGLPRPPAAGLPQINGTVHVFNQNTSNIADTAEAGDHFGATLTGWNFGKCSHADLSIGVPDEDILVSLGGDLGGIRLETRTQQCRRRARALRSGKRPAGHGQSALYAEQRGRSG